MVREIMVPCKKIKGIDRINRKAFVVVCKIFKYIIQIFVVIAIVPFFFVGCSDDKGGQQKAVLQAKSEGPNPSDNIDDTHITPKANPSTAPDPPANMQVTSVDGVITITWDDPNDPSITGYKYRARVVGESNWRPDWTLIEGSGATTITGECHNIGPGVPILFEIRAANAIGDGEVSSVETIGT